MKKFFTLTVLALAAMAATAQTTKNMFPAADTDADGWLWFDTCFSAIAFSASLSVSYAWVMCVSEMCRKV